MNMIHKIGILLHGLHFPIPSTFLGILYLDSTFK